MNVTFSRQYLAITIVLVNTVRQSPIRFLKLTIETLEILETPLASFLLTLNISHTLF